MHQNTFEEISASLVVQMLAPKLEVLLIKHSGIQLRFWCNNSAIEALYPCLIGVTSQIPPQHC